MKVSQQRYPSPSPSGTSQQHGFVCMSTTVDELSYTPSQEEKTRDAEQIVATGRKSWKTLRGKGEAVWPPLLEAALIEALEKYQLEAIGPKGAQKSGRFPMRNRFVSDYIYETTGKTRTPKQVGSRLQQLRDTCKGEKILQLISHRGTPECQITGSQSDGSIRASVTPPPDRQGPSPTLTTIYVQISLQKELRPCPAPAIRFMENDSMNPHIIKLSPRSYVGSEIKASTCSILTYLSGTVEFPSPYALVLQSTFLVYMDDSPAPLHSEIAPLQCLSSPMQPSGWLYSSEIAPEFWDTLCSTPDLTRYTILQCLRPIPAVHFDSDSSRPIFIAYKFGFQEPAVQTGFNTPPAYPVSYPTSTLTHNQPISMVTDYPQWRVPPEDVDTKINYALPNQQRETSFSVPTLSESSAYSTNQPLSIPIQRQDYPVSVNNHPQQNFYCPNSASSPGWSNEQNSGQQGQYWQHRH
ncbi:hypothetical protein BYT27DRAFT_7181660 [Phlegmacium glaucopus]|nr:hypothetical protein BYT27DRAFT_7181660 [Phlegmacium glaucopus]